MRFFTPFVNRAPKNIGGVTFAITLLTMTFNRPIQALNSDSDLESPTSLNSTTNSMLSPSSNSEVEKAVEITATSTLFIVVMFAAIGLYIYCRLNPSRQNAEQKQSLEARPMTTYTYGSVRYS